MRPWVAAVWALAASAQTKPSFSSSTYLVVAPVTVVDKKGKPIEGLTRSDFVLLDNGQPRSFDADGYIPPISLIIAVETHVNSAAALTKVRRIGPLITPLITGERGSAAVIVYGEEAGVRQEFTHDPELIEKAVAELKPDSSAGAMLDAASLAVELFRKGPSDARRVLLIVGESKDLGSQTKLSDAVTALQRENVLVYALTYSRFLSPWTVKHHEVPKSGPMNLLAMFAEIGRAAKEKTAEVLADASGGRSLGFLRNHGLEAALSAIGEELQNQYLLSFSPADTVDEYHHLEIRVPSRRDAKVRTRSGYWLMRGPRD